MANASAPADQAFADLSVDHIKLYVDDLAESIAWYTSRVGLRVYPDAHVDPATDPEVRSAALGHARIRLVLAQPLTDDHPGTAYLAQHGDGVADIALRVNDATTAFEEALRRGAAPVSQPAWNSGICTATIKGFGDVTHTFVQRDPDSGADVATSDPAGSRLIAVDHFAVCVEPGQLDATVRFYEDVLAFNNVFSERIVVGNQAIETVAVQSASASVTLTLIQPDASKDAGQIDEFLKAHGGPGVQHIALSTDNIVDSITSMDAAGMEFLPTPAAYYSMLADRLTLGRYSTHRLQELNILADQDHDGQLFQIFARSTHPRGTLFLEIIERLGAQTFGGGNIAALYKAVDRQRDSDHAGR
ncbi:4-hydroxyphenylpyruvate dioxygenase [Winogradskya consettensis]|uniref:4-hydroxyphenylpyruvate dioxygenase n=1 Tax=Winogradskya consettensis TaxID=113560 RepID=A0A919SC06_9ACTN|nr:4-hydroxyphenylpyruvate dioxygenase [Actinoplanes consettensis]GIM67740.1 4-hydroxyphenylpyruvate dioxygenase [Actinoplanes consettensis]